LLKVKLDGPTVAAMTPVPVRLTVGLTLALSVIVSVSLRTPATVGSKNTEIVQLAPAPRFFEPLGQVFVCV
jgi:hypothetical protein